MGRVEDQWRKVLCVFGRVVYRVEGMRGVMRVVSMVGSWELCDGPFEDVAILVASRPWRLLDI